MAGNPWQLEQKVQEQEAGWSHFHSHIGSKDREQEIRIDNEHLNVVPERPTSFSKTLPTSGFIMFPNSTNNGGGRSRFQMYEPIDNSNHPSNHTPETEKIVVKQNGNLSSEKFQPESAAGHLGLTPKQSADLICNLLSLILKVQKVLRCFRKQTQGGRPLTELKQACLLP